MRQFRWPALWLGAWIAGWLLCIVLSLIHPPQLDVPLPESDKIGHLFAYAALSAWAVLIFDTRRARICAALSLVALGIALELAQGAFTSDRMMDGLDALADALGVLAGQCLALSPARTWLQRWERRWSR